MTAVIKATSKEATSGRLFQRATPRGWEKSLLVTQLTKDITDTEMRLTASGANEEQQREERIDQKLLEDQKEKLTNIEK